MLRSSIIAFVVVVGLLTSPSLATIISITASHSNGVGSSGWGDPGQDTTPKPYNGPLVAGDIVNIAFYGFTDAPPVSDCGVGTFELLLSYDSARLHPRQYVKPGFGGGSKYLLSNVVASGSIQEYLFVADMTADGTGFAFSLTPEVKLDDAAHTVMLAGAAHWGLKNLGVNNEPILIAQVAFDVLADLTSSPTTVNVTGSSINPIGGFKDGDSLDLLGSTFGTNGGSSEILIGVPEPASMLLLSAGALFLVRRRPRLIRL